MATKYQMQGKRTGNGALISWLSNAPDWAAAVPAGDGIIDLIDIAVAGGGIDDGSESFLPDKTITLTDGSTVTLLDGSYAVTT